MLGNIIFVTLITLTLFVLYKLVKSFTKTSKKIKNNNSNFDKNSEVIEDVK